MREKTRKLFQTICDVADIILAVIVAAGIAIALIGIFPSVGELWLNRAETAAFMEFLDAVLSVVIGVEFLKMLCKPDTENIIETLVFLIARHMIVQTTTAVQDMISVLSICALFLVRHYLTTRGKGVRRDDGEEEKQP